VVNKSGSIGLSLEGTCIILSFSHLILTLNLPFSFSLGVCKVGYISYDMEFWHGLAIHYFPTSLRSRSTFSWHFSPLVLKFQPLRHLVDPRLLDSGSSEFPLPHRVHTIENPLKDEI